MDTMPKTGHFTPTQWLYWLEIWGVICSLPIHSRIKQTKQIIQWFPLWRDISFSSIGSSGDISILGINDQQDPRH